MSFSLEVFDVHNSGLAWNFRVSPDSCDNPGYYSDYIRLSALSDSKVGMGYTRVLVDTDESGYRKLAGFVTLRASSLVTESSEGKRLVNPAVEIAELAVDEEYHSSGVGTELVNIAISIVDKLRREWIGIKHIVVCADPYAVGFYEKMGFSPIGNSYEVLYDGWNDNCVPMYMRLPEVT